MTGRRFDPLVPCRGCRESLVEASRLCTGCHAERRRERNRREGGRGESRPGPYPDTAQESHFPSPTLKGHR